jgi:hypothetical protein
MTAHAIAASRTVRSPKKLRMQNVPRYKMLEETAGSNIAGITDAKCIVRAES